MTDYELQLLVEQISVQFFRRPFLHQAVFNHRLKSTGGRYHLNDHHLDFNPLVFEKYGKDELIAVVKHELCHYHLHQTGKGYQHRDRDFKHLLAETGGSRFVRPLADSLSRWLYICSDCQTEFKRQKKINTQRFVCGKCRGKLILRERRQ